MPRFPRLLTSARGRPFPPLFACLLAALPVPAVLPARAAAPDSGLPAGPRGEVRPGRFAASRIFPGTVRDTFVYVPQQYSPARPACLVVFFDGAGFFKPDGAFRVPAVFDRLIGSREIPVTIAVGGSVNLAGGTAVYRRKVQAVGNTNARLAATP